MVNEELLHGALWIVTGGKSHLIARAGRRWLSALIAGPAGNPVEGLLRCSLKTTEIGHTVTGGRAPFVTIEIDLHNDRTRLD